MDETIEITLAGKPLAVMRPTLGQHRDLGVAIANAPPAAELSAAAARSIDLFTDIVAIGLRRTHPDMTPAAIRETETSIPEIRIAATAILAFYGYKAAAAEAAA
jgi:hypothetical protein